MEESASTKKFTWGKVAAGTITVIGLVGSIVGIATGMIPILPDLHKVDGTWTLKTQTENSTENKYRGMELTYTVNLNHDGTHVTGKGHKQGEKLAGLTYTPYEGKAHTPIDIDGSLDRDGDSLNAVFTEEGEKRSTSGCLELSWNGKSKSWVGTFKSEAAESRGTALLSPSK